MTQSRIRSVLAVVCLACGVSQAAPPADQPPFGEVVEVNVVNVDVHVTDQGGRPVPGLQRDDFEVYEDGKRVKLTNFERIEVEPATAEPAPAASVTALAGAASTDPPPEDRLHLVIYVDNFNLNPAHRTRVLQQVRGFLKDLRPEDRVMLVTNDLGLTIRLPFTGDPAALNATLDMIERLPAQGATAESDRRTAMRQILEVREAVRVREGPCSRSLMAPAESYAEISRNQVLQSLKSLTVLVNSLSGVPGRKAVLYVSDGLPANPGEEVFQLLAEICGGGSASGIQDVHDAELEGPDQISGREVLMKVPHYSVVADLDRFATHANANRVTLYTLQATGLQSASSASADYGPNERLLQLPNLQFVQTANLQNSLTLLATETGGKAILNANDVSLDLHRMQDDLSTYYSLGYVPEHSGDGREHRIEVKVRKPGLQIRSRRSYRDKPSIERAVDRTLAAVYHGFEDNPLEVTLKLGEQVAQDGDRFQVPIKLRIPLFKLAVLPQQDRIYRGRLRLLVSTRDEQGGVSPIRQIQVPLEIPEQQILYAMGQFYEYDLILVLPRGEQHVAIAIRDEGTTTLSVLSRTLSVGGAPAR
jgi:VWFA-related protein